MKKLILLLCLITSSTMGQVLLDRNVVIHLLERDKYANFLETENTRLSEQIRLKTIENSSLSFQIKKYKSDSVAAAAVHQSLNEALLLMEEDAIKQEQASRKEVGKWKGRTLGSIVIAILAVILAAVT